MGRNPGALLDARWTVGQPATLRRRNIFPLTLAPLLSLSGLLVAVPVGLARAQEGDPSAIVDQVFACPSTSAVWAGVGTLIGSERLPQARPPADLVVRDQGPRYAVTFGGRSQEYLEEARNCEERAQVAAVFVALILVPPQFLITPPEAVPAPSSPTGGTRIDLEVAPWAGWAAHRDAPSTTFTGGAVARVRVGGGRVAGLVGVGASLPATTAAGIAAYREQRFPAEVGVRAAWRRPGWEAALDLLGVATVLNVTPRSGRGGSTTVDWGAKAGMLVLRGQGRFLPFVGAFADISPAPRAIALEPIGIVGHTSWLRIGATAGLAWRIH